MSEIHKFGHKQMQKTLQTDSAAYTESVGKHEKRVAGDIFSHENGKGTVLRLFFWRDTTNATKRLELCSCRPRRCASHST